MFIHFHKNINLLFYLKTREKAAHVCKIFTILKKLSNLASKLYKFMLCLYTLNSLSRKSVSNDVPCILMS